MTPANAQDHPGHDTDHTTATTQVRVEWVEVVRYRETFTVPLGWRAEDEETLLDKGEDPWETLVIDQSTGAERVDVVDRRLVTVDLAPA